MITCAEAVRQLWEYLDGALPDENRTAIEEHLSFCRRCCGEAEFAEELRGFLAREAGEEIPDEVRTRLLATLNELGVCELTRDLMHAGEIKEIVREAYGAIDSSTEAVACKLYSPEELALVPRSAVERALGVGNHLRFADVARGETLLDLGCGAGIDSILAAHRTGPSGRVIALDFLPEMLERTALPRPRPASTTSRFSKGRSRPFRLRTPPSTMSYRTASSTLRHASAACWRSARVCSCQVATCPSPTSPWGTRSSRPRSSPTRPPGRAESREL